MFRLYFLSHRSTWNATLIVQSVQLFLQTEPAHGGGAGQIPTALVTIPVERVVFLSSAHDGSHLVAGGHDHGIVDG